MQFFESNPGFYEKKVEQALTIEDIEEINKTSPNFETCFNNKIYFSVQQEDLTRNFLLQNAAKELLDKCREGYLFNLKFTDFIENILLLFNYDNNEVLPILYQELPVFLKIIIHYHNFNNMKPHSWIEQLTKELSIKDIMDAFNIEGTENYNIKLDRARIEPYCILLEAALQELSFENGKKQPSDIFTFFLQAHAIINNIKQFDVKLGDKFNSLSLFYPVKTRFLIDMISKINFTYFLNGLIILSEKMARKPSRKFFQNIINTVLKENAYTICGAHYHNIIPSPSPFYIVKPSLIYKPFKLDDIV